MKKITLPRFARRLLAVAALTGATAALAGPFDDIEARRAIVELRTRMEAVQASQARLVADLQKSQQAAASAQGRVLDLESQLQAVRGEQARVTAQAEQGAKAAAEAQRQQREQQLALDDRLKRLEPVKVNVDGREFVAEPTERRLYDTAIAAVRQNDLAAAQQSFADLLRLYPQSGYRTPTLFWNGQALYGLQRCKEALPSLRQFLTSAPDSPRVPDAKLAAANCEIELNDPVAARQTLEDLLRAHPRAEASASARERLKTLAVPKNG